MKKLIAYLGLFILMILFSVGCTNLDEEVYSQLPIELYGKTETEVNSLMAPLYTDLQKTICKSSAYCATVMMTSDMAIAPTKKGGDWWNGGVFKELTLGTWTPLNNYLKNVYTPAFNNITHCNQILYMIERSEAITDKVPYTSQARAARAFWYMELCDKYGNVPIVTDFTDLSMPSTTTRKEVYEFIMSELNDIKDVIRSDVSTSSYGKFTKGAVYTMLATMYLNAMVWNPAGGEKWQECIDACNVVLSLPYSLEPVWKDNFIVNNEGCKESILVCINSDLSGFDLGRQSLHYLDPIALGFSKTVSNGVTGMPDYVRSFDTLDKRYRGTWLLGPMINPATGKVLITAHGRPLIHTIDITMKYNIDADGWGQAEQEDGARLNKWEYKKGPMTDMTNDYAVFRLAEVYLMKAEALVRMGGDNVEATRLVNEIRKRVFTDPAKLKTSVTLNDIYMERRFEFAWEEKTRRDQVRFGTFLNPKPGFRANAIDAHYLLFPIPKTAIDANPNLVQNPGY